jgi:hypothetical protein
MYVPAHFAVDDGELLTPVTGRPTWSRPLCNVRGYAVMAGYNQQPDATAAAIDVAGRYHTGDPEGEVVDLPSVLDQAALGQYLTLEPSWSMSCWR